MRVVLNGMPLIHQRSGIGNYVYYLGGALQRNASPGEIQFYYPGGCDPARREFPSPLYKNLKAWSRLLPSSYSTYRRGMEILFQWSVRGGEGSIYHETNCIPLPLRTPQVLTVFDLSFCRYPDTHPTPRVRFFEKHFYSRLPHVTHFITVSESIKREMVKTLTLPSEKITVTPLGCDAVFHPRMPAELKPHLRKWGLSAGEYVFSVGNREPRKNLKGLVEAYKELPATLRRRYPLVLAGGTGWLMSDWARKVEKLGIASDVRMVGYVKQDDLPSLYAGAALLAFPSFYEGFGLPLVEAMASGCPVVTSGISSMPEVMGDAGCLVDPYRVESIREGIRKVLEDPAFRDSLRVKGLARAGMFTWDRCAAATMEVYRRVDRECGGAGVPSPIRGAPPAPRGQAAVFLDRDGTLNVDKGYVHRWEDWEWLPGVPEALREMAGMGMKLVVLSNQSGIARGFYSAADVDRLHDRVRRDLEGRGVRVDGFYFCPHGPEEGCACRKPRSGLIERACRELGLDPASSYLIGDKASDAAAARAAGVKPILVATGRDAGEKDRAGGDGAPVVDSLREALRLIRAGRPSSVAVCPNRELESVGGYRQVRQEGGDETPPPAPFALRAATVDVGIVNYHDYAHIPACLHSLSRQTHPPDRVFLQDNSGEVEALVFAVRDHPGVQVLPFQGNRGYAGGANDIIRAGTSDFVLILNPDVELNPDFIARLLASMGDPRVGAAGGKLVRPTGELDSTGFVFSPSRWFLDRGQGEPDRSQYAAGEVFAVCGAAIFLRRAMLVDAAVGGMWFDEDFFVFHEDTDLCWRAGLLGWKVRYEPSAVALHHRGWKRGIRSAVPRSIRIHSFKNRLMEIIKNETPRSFLKHGVFMGMGMMMGLVWVAFREPFLVAALSKVGRMFPTLWQRRGEVMRRRRHPRRTTAPGSVILQ
jgi:alpha-1,3-rhamnosyl/mannosyltransferase